jgi:hypothetical protein
LTELSGKSGVIGRIYGSFEKTIGDVALKRAVKNTKFEELFKIRTIRDKFGSSVGKEIPEFFRSI